MLRRAKVSLATFNERIRASEDELEMLQTDLSYLHEHLLHAESSIQLLDTSSDE